MTCGTRLLSMEELSCLDLNHVESGWIAESERRRPEGTLLTGQPNIYARPDCVSFIYWNELWADSLIIGSLRHL